MITSKTGSFMESKVRVQRLMENGEMAKINELYVVNAVSFTECESKMTAFIAQQAQGEFEVLTEQWAKYREIILSDNAEENIFYRARVAFVTINERTGKEKRDRVDFLVKGCSIETAKANIDEHLKGTMIDYVIQSVGETGIEDIVN